MDFQPRWLELLRKIREIQTFEEHAELLSACPGDVSRVDDRDVESGLNRRNSAQEIEAYQQSLHHHLLCSVHQIQLLTKSSRSKTSSSGRRIKKFYHS